jgi:hypothetical protein
LDGIVCVDYLNLHYSEFIIDFSNRGGTATSFQINENLEDTKKSCGIFSLQSTRPEKRS